MIPTSITIKKNPHINNIKNNCKITGIKIQIATHQYLILSNFLPAEKWEDNTKEM